MSNNVSLAVPWQTAVNVLDGAWSSTHPTRLCIPPRQSWIELKAGVVFQANVLGMRQIYSRQNGSDRRSEGYRAGYMSHTSPPGLAGSNYLSFVACSGIMSVEPGDYFELMVYQDSGSELWLGGDSESSFRGSVFFEAKFWQ